MHTLGVIRYFYRLNANRWLKLEAILFFDSLDQRVNLNDFGP